MIGRIVEVADDRRHLFVNRGFMVVKDTEGEGKKDQTKSSVKKAGENVKDAFK